MPFQSQAQRGLMYATAAGANTGVPKPVAQEFIASDKPGKLPGHVKQAYGGGLGTPSNDNRYQMGGGLGMSMSLADPYWTRAEARQLYDQPFHGGLIPSSGAGRTDQLPLSVAADSHVIPAQEIAGLGQGNTLSGGRMLTEALRIGPYGTPLPSHMRGPGPPHPPAPERYAEGGSDQAGHDPKTSILAAGGEYVIPREDWVAPDEHGQQWLHAGVRTLGEGDLPRGHLVANRMIHNIRAHTLEFIKNAPPPKS